MLGGMSKAIYSQFADSQIFSSNLNTINLKFFLNYGGIYQFDLERLKVLRCLRNMTGYSIESNPEEQS